MERRELAAEVVRTLLEERTAANDDPLRDRVERLVDLLERQGPAPHLLSVEQFCAKHPGLPLATFRGYLARREHNGLNAAVIKFEGRLLIDELRMVEALRHGSIRPRPGRRGRKRAA